MRRRPSSETINQERRQLLGAADTVYPTVFALVIKKGERK
jgi:hypothetical protein